jgi:hypothetical protein
MQGLNYGGVMLGFLSRNELVALAFCVIFAD